MRGVIGGASIVVLDRLVPGAIIPCFGAEIELDLVLKGIGLAVLDLALDGEGNWVAGMGVLVDCAGMLFYMDLPGVGWIRSRVGRLRLLKRRLELLHQRPL